MFGHTKVRNIGGICICRWGCCIECIGALAGCFRREEVGFDAGKGLVGVDLGEGDCG